MTENSFLDKLRPMAPQDSLYREIDSFESDEDNPSSNMRPKHQVTKKIKKFGFRKKKYKSISDGTREKLINAIENEGLKIKQAAQNLRMNYSSAKSIFNIYKREGRLNKKNLKRRAESHEDTNLKSTPISEDFESSDHCHESKSQAVPKEEFSPSEGLGDQAFIEPGDQASNNSETAQSSLLLKREKIEWSDESSFKKYEKDLRQKVEIQEDLIQLHRNRINFGPGEDFVKQEPPLLRNNSGEMMSSKENYFSGMHQQPMFSTKLPTNLPPTRFLPDMLSLSIFGQNTPTTAYLFPQYNMNSALGSQMIPHLPNPYMQNMQNVNGLEPFISFPLFNNSQPRMSSSTKTPNYYN